MHKVLYCPCAHSPTLHMWSGLLKVKETDPVIILLWMSSQMVYVSTAVKICLYKADVRSTCAYILFQQCSNRGSVNKAAVHHEWHAAICTCRGLANPTPRVPPNGTAWGKSYQKFLQILCIVAFEVAPFSLFGKNILQLIFRVNCSTCSVTVR